VSPTRCPGGSAAHGLGAVVSPCRQYRRSRGARGDFRSLFTKVLRKDRIRGRCGGTIAIWSGDRGRAHRRDAEPQRTREMGQEGDGTGDTGTQRTKGERKGTKERAGTMNRRRSRGKEQERIGGKVAGWSCVLAADCRPKEKTPARYTARGCLWSAIRLGQASLSSRRSALPVLKCTADGASMPLLMRHVPPGGKHGWSAPTRGSGRWYCVPHRPVLRKRPGSGSHRRDAGTRRARDVGLRDTKTQRSGERGIWDGPVRAGGHCALHGYIVPFTGTLCPSRVHCALHG